jgi:hypothetical protein
MAPGTNDVHFWNGCVYAPFHTAPVSAGPYLSISPDGIEQHLELTPELYQGVRDRYVGGVGMPRRGLAAARIHGDSMICKNVFDKDVVLFEEVETYNFGSDKIVVIEKVSEEEGFGAWALKKLVVERHRSSRRNEFDEEIDWDDPVLVLRSYNPRVGLVQLHPSGLYRVHGIFLRSIRGYEARFVDSNVIRQLVRGKP